MQQLVPKFRQSTQVVLGLAVEQRLLADTAPRRVRVPRQLLADGQRIQEQIRNVFVALLDLEVEVIRKYNTMTPLNTVD